MHQERVATAFWKRVTTAQNMRFQSALRPDRDAPVLLLSPHLDDAVLDCWSVLTADAELEVVNVFGLAPPAGTTTEWDRVLGSADSAALFAARLEEDALALGLAGRASRNLPFLEFQYRRGRRFPAWAEIDAVIAALVPRAARVLAPMVLGDVHPDHALLRDYALALARQGHAVSLYADSPYCAQFGWPAWVTGETPVEHLDVEAFWSPSFDSLPVEQREGRAIRLDDAAGRHKLNAIRAYRTQFPALDRGPIGRLSNPAIHRWEVLWEL